MRDYERRIDLPLLDSPQQVVGPAVDVRLPHAPCEALVHRRTERNLVEQPAVHAGHRQRAGRTANVDHFPHVLREMIYVCRPAGTLSSPPYTPGTDNVPAGRQT